MRAALFVIFGLAQAAFGQEMCRDLDASRLRTGTFHYRTLVDGKDAGASRIQVSRSSDPAGFVFSNQVTGAFTQSWQSVATSRFVPLTAKLVFGEGDAAQTAFELAYRDGRVSGYAVARKENPPVRRPVDEVVAADTVDQRIDWAAVMSFPEYEPGRECVFHVYDPGTGNSLVHVTTGSVTPVNVPAGGFDGIDITYRIDKKGGAEVYRLTMGQWGDRRARFLLKEVFPNGAVTELVRIEP